MRILFTAALWFLAAWVVVDITCYVLGLSRQATPFVAALVGTVAALVLVRARSRGAAMADRRAPTTI